MPPPGGSSKVLHSHYPFNKCPRRWFLVRVMTSKFKLLKSSTKKFDAEDVFFDQLSSKLQSSDFADIEQVIILIDSFQRPNAQNAFDPAKQIDFAWQIIEIIQQLNSNQKVSFLTQNFFDLEINNAKFEKNTQAWLSPLLFSISQELPGQWQGWVDVLTDSAGSDLKQAINLLLQPPTETVYCLRNKQLFGQRLQRRNIQRPQSQEINIQAEHSYLLAGGSGGLGRQISYWLVQKGVRHLVWVSNRPLNELAKTTREDLEKSGANVHVVQADITNWHEFNRSIQELPDDLPEFAGVFQLVGKNTSLAIKALSKSKFNQLVSPKAFASWHLHLLSKNDSRFQNIAFFVGASSISSVWGGREQSAYATSNGYLDALMAYRKEQNLPSQNIHWGPWAASSMLQDSIEHQLAQIGIYATPNQVGLNLIDQVLTANIDELIHTKIDWFTFKEIYQQYPWRKLLVEIIPEATKPKSISVFNYKVLNALKGQTEIKKTQIITEYLESEIMQILGHTTQSRPDFSLTFADLGMDSLMAVALTKRIQDTLGVKLPATLIFEAKTLHALSAYLVAELNNLTDAETKPAADNPFAADEQQVQSEISDALNALEDLLGEQGQ